MSNDAFGRLTTYEAFREVTGWVRPGHAHGCKPCEIVPGVWTAHYDEIDSVEKLHSATNHAPIHLVVNSALCQCESRAGFYGDRVEVMEIMLEDDPDELKQFDQGKPNLQSKCREKDVPLTKRSAGDAMQYFDACTAKVDATLAAGGHVLVHCKASLSRSAAFLIAYLMKSRKMSLLDATRHMKARWDATWPCNRFALQLIEYEAHLASPHRHSTAGLATLCAGSAALGAAVAYVALLRR